MPFILVKSIQDNLLLLSSSQYKVRVLSKDGFELVDLYFEMIEIDSL